MPFGSRDKKQSRKWGQLVQQVVGRVNDQVVEPVVEGLTRRSPGIMRELKTLARHPRSFSTWIETQSPWLSRQFLSAASNWAEPFTLGMGLSILRLQEENIEVSMHKGWRNQGDGGLVHSGALATLGEFTGRLFWEHHLDLQSSCIESRRVQVRILAKPFGAMKAVFRLPVADREVILLRLRAESSTVVDTQTRIYDVDGRLVAEVDVDWLLLRQLALGTSQS